MDRLAFEDLFKKIKQISGGVSQREVAERLGISPQAISDAKRKNRIPETWYEIIYEKFGVTKETLYAQMNDQNVKIVPLFKSHPPASNKDNNTVSHEQTTDVLGYEEIMNEFFKLVKQWQAEINGRCSRTAIDFIQEFPLRFGEMAEWQKKKEKGKLFQFEGRKIGNCLVRDNK